MGVKLENSFAIDAPIDDAWRLLVDVPRMVPCMPGAELTERLDERRFRATVRLKVGPVDMKFAGEGELHDIDATTHRAKLRAKGRDGKGRGSFQADMQFALTPQGAGSVVHVDTDLTLTGSVAQYGRGAGIVREIAGQLTGQFARNLASLVARSPGEAQAVRPADDIGAAPAQPVEPLSLFSLLVASLKAAVRRWLGDKKQSE